MTIQNKGVPALRFPEFEGEWERKKFEDFAPLQRGFDITEKEQKAGFVPVISSGGISSYHNEFKVKGPGVVVGRKGTLGRVFYIPDNYWPHDTSLWVTSFKDNHPKYVYYFLISFQLERFGTGGSVPSLNRNNVHTQNIVVPNVIEQQKIAAFLTAVDKRILQLTKKKDLLEQYKKGVIQKIFNQEIRFKDDNGNNFADWEEENLGTYLTHKSTRNNDLSVDLVLSVNNKKGFITQQEQFEDHVVASKDLSNYKIVSRNDYAYNPSRINVGSISRLKQFNSGIVSPMYVVFRTKNTLQDEFFDYLLQTHYFKHLIKIGCSGSVRDSLNFEAMCEFVVKLPTLPEQRKIANFLSAIDDKINLVNQQLEKTQTFKKGLLQQMFI